MLHIAEGAILEDTSTNGTWINNGRYNGKFMQKNDRQELKDGDTVKLYVSQTKGTPQSAIFSFHTLAQWNCTAGPKTKYLPGAPSPCIWHMSTGVHMLPRQDYDTYMLVISWWSIHARLYLCVRAQHAWWKKPIFELILMINHKDINMNLLVGVEDVGSWGWRVGEGRKHFSNFS